VVVPGFPRCGTTWLHEVFRAHPDIFVPPRKEIHYFDRNLSKGLAWYGEQFAGQTVEPLVADVTPTYILERSSLTAMKDQLDPPRIIVVLRNPVDRFHSNYLHEVRAGWDLPAFEEVAADPDYVATAFHAHRVEALYELFPADRILIRLFEEGLADAKRYIGEIWEFLGLDPIESFSTEAVNPSVQPRWLAAHRLLKRMHRWGRRRHSRRLDLVLDGLKQAYARLLVKRTERPSIPPSLRSQLGAAFVEDATRLSRFADRDLVAFWGLQDGPSRSQDA
jgi:hypothetical protein